MNRETQERLRKLLCDLQWSISDAIVLSRRSQSEEGMSAIASVTRADTIYSIDKVSEESLLSWFEKNWPTDLPLQLVMEGIEDEDEVTFPANTPVSQTLFKCIMDPIDGTRGVMYDKRSAWVLAGIAPQKGNQTQLSDIEVAVQTEIPLRKQFLADQISAVRGGGKAGVLATRRHIIDHTFENITLRPSRAINFAHGFAALSRFFPEGKALCSEIEEALWRALPEGMVSGDSVIFDDQYISTGGQFYEVLAGHDRMLGDIRPFLFRKRGSDCGLVCHPYDACTALILSESGCVVEDPRGGEIRGRLDTTTPICWMVYANVELAQIVRPVLYRVLDNHLGAEWREWVA